MINLPVGTVLWVLPGTNLDELSESGQEWVECYGQELSIDGPYGEIQRIYADNVDLTTRTFTVPDLSTPPNVDGVSASPYGLSAVLRIR